MHAPEGEKLRSRLAWIGALEPVLTDAWPDIPDGVVDRDADVWEPLLAIADQAGGQWPDAARVAAVALVAQSKGSTPSLNVRLLADLRTVFGDRDQMSTEQILTALCDLDESPWGQLYGKPLNALGLSRRLREYEVASKNVRDGDKVVKGYTREDLWDPWQRYLGPAHQEPATPATPATEEPRL